MVGLQTLDLAIGVRVPASQPQTKPTEYVQLAHTNKDRMKLLAELRANAGQKVPNYTAATTEIA